jgi:fatty acid desaturase
MNTVTKPSGSLHRDLRLAVTDLETVNPWQGVARFVGLGVVVLSLMAIAWLAPSTGLFLGVTAIAGVAYAFWLICTHDATHHTLTGWSWFDDWLPRFISWPMLWTYGTYAQLHRLHHGWNGIDLRDPERVQWTVAEYEQANPLTQWYVRHQWAIDILGLAGIGLIIKTVLNALRLGRQFPTLHRALLGDGAGILIMQTGLILIALSHHRLLDYLLFWLVLERVIGALLQARDHLEHYGLWGTTKSHQLTQLYACRNLNTPPFMAWLVGGLNDHAIHHAFPSIPFNRLPEAFRRIDQVLQQHHLPPLQRDAGYLQETWHLSLHPSLIGQPQPSEPTGRYQMVGVR